MSGSILTSYFLQLKSREGGKGGVGLTPALPGVALGDTFPAGVAPSRAVTAAKGTKEQEQPRAGARGQLRPREGGMGMATIFLCKFWDDTNIPNSLSEEHHFLTLTNLVESLNEAERGERREESCVCRGKCGSFQPGMPRGTNPGKALE